MKKGEGKQNAPSHQQKKKVLKFSHLNDEKCAQQVWKRKQEVKKSANLDSIFPTSEFFQQQKKQSTNATRSP
jgi:hypothetical protein